MPSEHDVIKRREDTDTRRWMDRLQERNDASGDKSENKKKKGQEEEPSNLEHPDRKSSRLSALS